MRQTSSVAAVVLAVGSLHASCIDPTHDSAVDALGGEAAGVRKGPTHRPGQPCLTCHGGIGPGSPEMTVAGTVYVVRGGTDPASDVTVTITDSHQAVWSTTTNSVGTFYVFKSEWDPAFPLTVKLSSEGQETLMKSSIGRDGACATCHRGTGDAEQMPAVYLRPQ